MSRRGPVLALLASLLALPAGADVHPNTAPGFPAEQSFHIGDVDSVNLFNGALTLTIPIGGPYPVNGGFSYSLKLTYNSSPWQFLTVHRVGPGNTDLTKTQALPNKCSNAGLGWRVSFGRMDPPCQVQDESGNFPTTPIYQDENGTDHIFYPTLHQGDAEDTLPTGVFDVQYTRDGSYLRLKKYTAGYREVEFPDGSVRRFDALGMPTLIKDAFGNSLTIDYGTSGQWVLTDGQNRTQRIYFRYNLPSYPQGVIDRIELTTFNGGPKAVYQFNYSSQVVGLPCPNNDTGIDGVGNKVNVPLLSSVTLPDNTSWAPNSYITTVPTDPNGCTDNGGNLTALTLPTLGRLEWSWQTVYLPTGSLNRPHLQRDPAVATRTMRNADTSVQGSWTYAYAPGFPAAISSAEHTTTVTYTLGTVTHKTINYFSTSLDPSYTGWSQYDYSLPFSRNYPISAGSATLNLSRQTSQIVGGVETVLRSEYVLYERDPAFGVSAPHFYNINRRLLQSRTLYNDDVVAGSPVYGGVINSSFDGLGHYRTQTTDGSFPGSNARTHFANYNAAQGTYVVNPATNTGSGYNLFPASSPWVLEAPTSASDSEGGATAQVDLCYYPGSAAVTRKRVHRSDGATLSTKDLLSVYDVSAQGNVTAEKSYGGDAASQALSTGSNLCSLSLPASPEVEIDHTYSSGVRATSQYSGTTFKILDQSIDASTGLTSSSRDTSGLQTNYEYDAFGRQTWSEPQGAGNGGWTEYAYTPASGSIKPNVIVRRRANGSKTATVLAVNQIVFDSFGRVFQELKNLPDGSTAKRETDYDEVGNKSKVSEWTAGQPGNFTQYLNYDPFGRPGVIRPADGAAHDVTLTYLGVRQVDRKAKIATAVGSESLSTTTEVYDRHGRLLSVTEPSGSGGANVTTTYGYEVGNRLSSASTTANVGGSNVTQSRSFSYDRAGLLTSETHPEKGTSGNGSVTYPQHDSRGHTLQKIDGPNDLTFFYDSAERMYQIKETGASGRLLKAFTYAPANGTNDWRKGKLQVATRYNYVAGATVQIDETYVYGGRDGRVSQRNTQMTANGAAAESFTQGFTHNDLGLVSALSYPLCTHAGCTAPAVFADVPQGAPFQREIEAIYPWITAGCGGNNYCPNNNITRGQMALYLLKGKEGLAYNPPACTTQVFGDVPCSDPLAPWINELARRGVTSGCSITPSLYCPNNNITNAEMAVFVIQLAFQGTGFSVPSCSQQPFADVPCTYWSANWIAEEARRQITTGCGGGNFCPASYVTRASMAGLIVHAFDVPYKIDPATPRNVQFAYTQGLLTSAAGAVTYGTLTYYPNLLVNQVAHGNGITETQGNDPNEMRRPLSVGASGPYTSWSSGSYGYDGAGNVKAIGGATFTYDPVSRLVASTLYDGATGGGNQKLQSYTFDAFGNLTIIGGTSGRNTPTAPQTNRLNAAGTAYDGAGNLTNWNSAVYQYDAFNQLIRMTSGSEDWGYVYTADDERIWMYNLAANTSRWTLRDLGGKVLREYLNNNGSWSVGTDYIYRDGLLLAAETQTGQRHFHLDHLGTPRLITRAGGEKVAYHVYYPFGEEATAFNLDTERMKFTGHERDLASSTGAGDDLDYMHARHESPVTGRFLSVDPGTPRPKKPQTWNRYSYTTDNPMSLVDPNGRDPLFPNVKQFLEAFFGTDLSHIDVQYGLMSRAIAGVARNSDAVTIGSTINLSSAGAKKYSKISPSGVALMAHEIVHTFDYSRMGKAMFLTGYIVESEIGIATTKSLDRAYKSISFEVRADLVEALVKDFLTGDKDIRDKLAKGEALSKEELQRIRDYALQQVSAGTLREGLQYIDGNLTYVRLTVQ